jgi:hypothetical protein
MPKLPTLPVPEPTIEELLSYDEEEEDWGAEDSFFSEEPKKNLTMKRSTPKKNLTMKRR